MERAQDWSGKCFNVAWELQGGQCARASRKGKEDWLETGKKNLAVSPMLSSHNQMGKPLES